MNKLIELLDLQGLIDRTFDGMVTLWLLDDL